MKTQTLISIFVFSILYFAFCIQSNAQIAYTDVNPDQTFTTNYSVYHLDMNNNGTTDYDITMQTALGVRPYAKILFTPSAGNFVSSTNNYASAFSFGTSINFTNTWRGTTTVMGQDFWFQDWGHGLWHHRIIGNWLNVTDKYLGLKFISGGNTYYGWARLDEHVYSNGTADFTIKDFAYNSVPNQSILAGDTGNVLTNIIHNENLMSQFRVYPNPMSNSATVFFSLLQSQNASIELFDVNGRLIKSIAENAFEECEHQIVFDAEKINAGIYFLKIQAGAFLKTEKIIVTKK